MSVKTINVEKNETGIRAEVLDEIVNLAQIYKVKKVVLFGSRARGDYHPRSDIDLAVWGGDFIRFSLDVDDTTSTLLKYDFVDMEHYVQPELREAIQKEGVRIYEEK